MPNLPLTASHPLRKKKVDLPICPFAGILYRFHAQSYTQFTLSIFGPTQHQRFQQPAFPLWRRG